MDPIPDPSNCLTPAKHKAAESAAATEFDVVSKKLKVYKTPAAIEDDPSSDSKSEEDLLSKNQLNEKTPVAKEDNPTCDEESPEAMEDDEESSDAMEDDEEKLDKDVLYSENGVIKGYRDAFSNAPSNLKRDKFPPVEECYFPNEEAKRNYELYVEEYISSEGFDIKHFPRNIMGGFAVVRMDENDEKYVESFLTTDCKKSVLDAIMYYNYKEGRDLELEGIVRCLRTGFTWYYVTFKAKDKGTEVSSTYQTIVERHHYDDVSIVIKFRLSPQPTQ